MRLTLVVKLFLIVTSFFGIYKLNGKKVNACGCSDITPPAIDCYHQKYTLDSCETRWLVEEDYCAFTCDRCLCQGTCMCTDTPPDSTYSCKQLVFFEKCDEPWILDGNHCEYSCGRCNCTTTQTSDQNTQPAASVTMVGSVSTVILTQDQEQQTAEPAESTLLCHEVLLEKLQSNTQIAYLADFFASTPLLTLFQAENPTPYTLFIPSQQSWDRFLATLQDPSQLSQDPSALINLFYSHIVRGALQYEMLTIPQPLYTVSEGVFLETQTQLVNGVNVVEIGVVNSQEYYPFSQQAQSACNSLIYVLDGVLVSDESIIRQPSQVDTTINVQEIEGANQNQQQTIETPQVVLSEADANVEYQIEVIDTPETEEEDATQLDTFKIVDQGNQSYQVIDNIIIDEGKQLGGSDDIRQCSLVSALDIINTHAQLKVMRQLITKINLDNILQRVDLNMTLFLPIDSAGITAGDAGIKSQASLLQLDPQIISDIVRYHIILQELVNLENFEGSRSFITLSDSRMLTVTSGDPSTVQGESYSAIIVDENVANGCTVAIHLLDKVLMPYSQEEAEKLYPSSPSPQPFSTQQCEKSVWDIISEQEGLSILAGSKDRVDRILLLSQPMTFFLPNERGQNEITQLAQALGGTLESAEEIAYDFIMYHIIANIQLLLDNQGLGLQAFQTFAQFPIQIVKEGREIFVEGIGSSAKVVPGVLTCSPVLVHYIDGALLPFSKEISGMKGLLSPEELQQVQLSTVSGTPSQCNNSKTILDYISSEQRLSILLEKAGDEIESLLRPTDGKATYFLPDNIAIQQLLDDEAVMQTFERESVVIRVILQFHAVEGELLGLNTIYGWRARQPYRFPTRYNGISLTLTKQFGSVMLSSEESTSRVTELLTFESCNTIVHIVSNALLPFSVSNSSITNVVPQQSIASPSPVVSMPMQVSDYSVQAVNEYVTRGESTINTEIQAVNASTQILTPTVAPSLGSNIAPFFPTPFGGVVAAPVSSVELFPGSSLPTQNDQFCNQTIGKVLEQINRLKQMSVYMRLAGFGNYLDQTNANITIVAPIESAYDGYLAGYGNLTMRQLAKDESQRELFVKIISYHIIPNPVSMKDTPVGIMGSFGTLAFDDGGYKMQVKMRKLKEPFAIEEIIEIEGLVNNATVSGSPLSFCRAFVYPVDKVLSLSDEEEEEEIPQVIISNPGPYRPSVNMSSLLPDVKVLSCIEPLQIIQNQNDLSTFINLVYFAEINQVINNLEEITIFAPTDQMLNQILSQFTDNLEQLRQQVIQNWMAYHIVQNQYELKDLESGLLLETLTVDSEKNKMLLEVVRRNGAEVDKDGDTVFLKGVFNEAYIIRSDLSACNATIHIINMPLLPVPQTNGRRRTEL